MRIGIIGAGKLGVPVSIGFSLKGHDVLCYDINPNITNQTHVLDLLNSQETCEDGKSNLRSSDAVLNCSVAFTTDLKNMVEFADIIFCAVQTPHDHQYEGVTPLLKEKKDFDYTYLITSIKQLVQESEDTTRNEIVLVVISTVLPGTIQREIVPLLSNKIKLIYNPYFIAMGTVLYDLFNPEFVLIGFFEENSNIHTLITTFYESITSAPLFFTTINTAEMIKVSYNTFITAKICIANQIMTLCDSIENVNCDDVMTALCMDKNRIISSKYLRGGMGDGGGCHPRDNIALSWLSDKFNLEYNFYDNLMQCREAHVKYLVKLLHKFHLQCPNLNVFLLGKSFKPETNIITGSPAILFKNLCELECEHYDPFVDEYEIVLTEAIYIILTQHEVFKNYKFPPNSIVIDPFRYLNLDQNNVMYYPVGYQKLVT